MLPETQNKGTVVWFIVARFLVVCFLFLGGVKCFQVFFIRVGLKGGEEQEVEKGENDKMGVIEWVD